MRREAAVLPFLLLMQLYVSIPTALKAQTCGGTERWQVKVGADSGVDSVRLDPIVQTTLQDVIRITTPQLPASSDNDTRLPEETNVYQLSGHLVEFKQEAGSKGDSDYHLVITDDTLQFTNDGDHHGPGHSLIAEIPDPDCIPGQKGDPDVASKFSDEISCVRAKMDAKFPTANKNGKFFDTGDTPSPSPAWASSIARMGRPAAPVTTSRSIPSSTSTSAMVSRPASLPRARRRRRRRHLRPHLRRRKRCQA
jgi:hypothetical protein